ncbi:MAG: Spy/CpxP family protein refolding chaperone [Gemmatimonadaceae bacterium]
MKRHLFTALAVAATMAAPALYAQTATTRPMPTAGAEQRGPGHDRMMAELKLTDAQKAQVKAVHAKYEPQVKAERDRLRPQMEAARAAHVKGDTANRADWRAAMEPMRKIHMQEQAEVRAVLTPEQQTKFDTMMQNRRDKGSRNGMKMGKMGKTGKMGRMGAKA